MTDSASTDFGFQQVSPGEKTRRVGAVFSSVAGSYDLMNDLMSLGLHRFWKRFAVHLSRVRAGSRVLDVAGGTGDLAALYRERVGDTGAVVLCDINADMLEQGRNRLLDKGLVNGIDYVQADAERLPFKDGYFDCISIGFGLRNVTDKAAALSSMHAKLRRGGGIVILEFSRVVLPLLDRLYHQYSFRLIPALGRMVAGDRESYEYLVESIRRHPDQETLKAMMEAAGFRRVSYHNLAAGVVAIHLGYKV